MELLAASRCVCTEPMRVGYGPWEGVEEEAEWRPTNPAKPHPEARAGRGGLAGGWTGVDWGKLCGWGES